ncbi:MAG: DNA translocase FtsK 4TM domain-containing protein, partial [Nitrospirae bacterium]|nr:DNA translocase FtsK 4TM domain-containing protein [Nitrospirota bacterium]
MMNRRLNEIRGIAAMLSSIYLALCLLSYDRWDMSFSAFSTKTIKNYGGIAGAYISDIVFSFLGLSGLLLSPFLFIYGLRQLLAKEGQSAHPVGVPILLISTSMFFELVFKNVAMRVHPPGGIVGVVLSGAATTIFSVIGAFIISISLILISFVLVSPFSVSSFISYLQSKRENKEVEELKEVIGRDAEKMDLSVAGINLRPGHELPKSVFPSSLPARHEQRRQSLADKETGDYPPQLDFLNDPTPQPLPSNDELNAAGTGLEIKLSDFGISGRVKYAHAGPVVTMYEFEPAPGVKINRVVTLADDLALALKSQSIRVYPIAGKATIGIEVPNRVRSMVFLKEIIGSDVFQKNLSLLTLALGKDIFGSPVVTDLARMPHLLVAGTTGSGKSVFMNTAIL